jgi:hypothetical protein
MNAKTRIKAYAVGIDGFKPFYTTDDVMLAVNMYKLLNDQLNFKRAYLECFSKRVVDVEKFEAGWKEAERKAKQMMYNGLFGGFKP